MPDVEFFHTNTDKPLHFDVEEGRYVWRQYTKGSWYVRVSGADVKTVFIKVGDEEFPLDKYVSDDCFMPSENVGRRMADSIERKTGHSPNPGGWVALLDLWSSNGKESPRRLDPPLYIEPGNLSGTDFDAIIERLQELAFFRYSPTQVKQENQGGSTEGGTEDNEDELLKRATEKFLALVNQVHSDWPLVQVTASRETQLLPKLIDLSSAAGFYSSRLVTKKAQHPHARRVEILMPQESFATVENRFLVFALQEIHKRAPLFEGRLMARSKELQEEWEARKGKEAKLRQSKPQWKQKQTEQNALADCMKSLAEDIAQAITEVTPYINEPFLHEVRDHPALPDRPTDRLTRSFAYGPIYGAFCDYQNQPGISFAPLKPGLMQALNSRSVHPACTLYELWVFVELYDMLVRTFGFRLPAGVKTGHPLDYVDSAAGEIVGDALKGKEFRLELRPANNQQRVITISLWYDTEEWKRRPGASNLRPDIYLEVTDSRTSNKAKPFMFAIDAKYHSYPGFYMRPEREKHGVDTVFDLDLLIIAKEKYHGKLGCDAAFVVHSDANEEYTYWGGRPYPLVKNGSQSKARDFWPEHHYGAVFSNPSNTRNLRRLLNCFLMYHVDIEGICWSCRREVEPQQKFYSGPLSCYQYDDAGNKVGVDTIYTELKLVGREYHCADCQRSWTRTWCRDDKEHKLYKIGGDSFHSRDGLGHMICATCGDGYTDSNTAT